MVDDTKTPSLPIPHMDHSLESIPITTQDVSDVFLHLDITKACGPDSISSHLLKEGCHILAHPYSIIFKRSLEQRYFPSSWKDANVTPNKQVAQWATIAHLGASIMLKGR